MSGLNGSHGKTALSAAYRVKAACCGRTFYWKLRLYCELDCIPLPVIEDVKDCTLFSS